MNCGVKNYMNEIFSGFLFATAKVAYITAMIFIDIINTIIISYKVGKRSVSKEKAKIK